MGEDDDLYKITEGKDAVDGGKWVAVANPDGVVREVKERRVISREETEEVKETEDVQHLGDITDEVSIPSNLVSRKYNWQGVPSICVKSTCHTNVLLPISV